MINSKAEEYIEKICGYIKFKKAHKEIRTELLSHIEEKTEDLMLEGMNEEGALKKVLAEMGEAETIGKRLNQIHKPAPEWSILIITILFSLLGLGTAYIVSTNQYTAYTSIYYTNIMFNIIGYLSVVGLYFFDYKKMEKYSFIIFIAITLILFMRLMIPHPGNINPNFKKNWIHLGRYSINITELSVFLYVISLSKLIKDLDLRNVKGYIYLSLMLLLPLSIYFQLKVFMEALIYFVVFIVFMFKSKVKFSCILSVIGAFFTYCFYTVFTEPYRIKRLLIFINPESDPKGMGYTNLQTQKLLSSVGLKGNGFNFPKMTIPDAYGDFILTYIIYTFGWIAGIALIVLVFTFMLRMFAATKRVKDTYGRFIIQGFMCIFAVEFIWNILMVLGFVPIISIRLPFISSSGSMALTQMVAIGLIMSIYRCKSLSYG